MAAPTDYYVDPSKQTRTACTITHVTTTATVTLNSHGYSNSDTVKIYGATQSAYNGNFVISNVTANTFDYTMGSDPAADATGSPLASKLNLAGDDGTTDAKAWADVQYALDNITQDATDGDRVNVKQGTAEVLASPLDITTLGAITFSKPLVFGGYASVAGDGGKGAINCNGDSFYSVTGTYTYCVDMEFSNSGSDNMFHPAAYSFIVNCKIDNTGNSGYCVNAVNRTFRLINCEIHGNNGIAIYAGTAGFYYANWFNIPTGSEAFRISGVENTVSHNIINCTGTSHGIYAANWGNYISNNSILSVAGTGTGILQSASSGMYNSLNNIIEGFSGAGGDGILHTLGETHIIGSNALYDNETEITLTDTYVDLGDNEILSATPFAKSGANTFANRFAYFAPKDIGNIWGGAYPVGSGLDKGAVQHTIIGAGNRHPLARF